MSNAPQSGNRGLATKTRTQTIDTLRARFDTPQFKSELKKSIQGELTPERILRVALTAAVKNEKLAQADPASWALALLTSSQLGLEPDGVHGHLVPFWNSKRNCYEVQFMPGYQGFIQAAYKHPKVKSVMADVVYDADFFEYERGLDMKLRHKPSETDEPGELRAAYAICEIEGGGKAWVVLLPRDIRRIKASSQSAKNDSSPWNLHTGAMWKKSAIRELAKYMPHSQALQNLIEQDDKDNNPEQYSDGVTVDIPPAPTTDDGGDDASQAPPTNEPPNTPPPRQQRQAPNTPKPPAAASTAAAAAPAAGDGTPAPTGNTVVKPPATAVRQGSDEDVVRLENLIAEQAITERQFLNWVEKKFNLSALDKVSDMLEVSPRRLAEVVDKFETFIDAIKAAPTE